MSQAQRTGHAAQAAPVGRVASGRPAVMVFDVNETLSDMDPLADSFERIGLDRGEVKAWFAGVLRDGFALATGRMNPSFADVASESLRVRLASHGIAPGDIDAAVEEVMTAFTHLPVHPDVVEGIPALRTIGPRLVTLSNGSTGVAEGLLARAGLSDAFERLLSVEDAPAWKPHPSSYAHALTTCAVSAEEALLVAVHPWDIDGAARAGLRTAWVNRTGSRYPSYFTTPEIEVPDLLALARILA
jgi:2-haloacid dehalogenase